MSAWNTDISAAPRDCRVWLASECGKVSPTYWNEKRKAWSGFGDKEQPVAWYPYFVPKHPFEMDRSTEGSLETGSEEAENARKAVPETEDGSVNHAGAGESPASDSSNAGGSHVTPGRNAHPQPSAVEPVSSSTEFAYLEDVGSGA